jgi:hypothetical protein
MSGRDRLSADVHSAIERRDLPRAVLAEAFVILEELRGRPQLRLSTLDDYPEQALKHIEPTVHMGVSFFRADEFIHAVREDGSEAVPLFRSTPVNLLLFSAFDGRTSLQCIADMCVAELGDPPELAFARTKHLFLELVRLGISVPANCVGA